jgi:hypothetical protein
VFGLIEASVSTDILSPSHRNGEFYIHLDGSLRRLPLSPSIVPFFSTSCQTFVHVNLEPNSSTRHSNTKYRDKP